MEWNVHIKGASVIKLPDATVYAFSACHHVMGVHVQKFNLPVQHDSPSAIQIQQGTRIGVIVGSLLCVLKHNIARSSSSLPALLGWLP